MILRIVIVILGISYTTADTTPVPVSTTSLPPPTPAPVPPKPLLLSPYIKQQKLEQARTDSIVPPSLFLNITSHAGFLTVNETENSNLFFWYFPVAGKPVNETPLIIWLQGGPGASSLAGLFNEVGPFQYENGTLKLRETSWTADYSVLFIDNHVGSGFSFTNSPNGYDKDVSTYTETCATHLYSGVQDFLTIFPQLRPAPMYLAGESFAGRYVPTLGYKIVTEQTSKNIAPNKTMNLKGMMIGNPVADWIDVANLSSVYFHWGLLDTQGLLAVKPLQDQYTQALWDNKFAEAWELRTKLLDLLKAITHQQQLFNVLKDPGNLHEFEGYLARPEVLAALHVGNITFTFTNDSVDAAHEEDFRGPIRPMLERMLESTKVLIYCGQLDLTAPCELNAEARRGRWRWSGRYEFLDAPRLPWIHDGRLAGHFKKGGGLTEVVVRGAGHLVPMDAPAAARALLDHLVSDQPLPVPQGYKTKPEYTPEYIDSTHYPRRKEVKANTPLIASVIVNVILILCLVAGVFVYRRFKRRSEAFFYSTVEDSISDGILTMT